MRSVALVSAVLAVGASVVSGATTCTEDIKITQPTQTIDCDVVDADITLDSSISDSVSIEGPMQLKKSLTISNATKLIGISSTSINSIQGTLKLDGLKLLSTFKMISLKSVGSLQLINLPQLGALTLGTEGVTKANSIVIADTFISDLSGLNVAEANMIDISNNAKLTMFNSVLKNVNKTLRLTNNGNNMQVNMSQLESAGDVQFRQVKSFDAPALTKVESIKFNDSPELLSVTADNLTDIKSSLTFINNKKVSKLSFKQLKTIKGDMTVQNNTALKELDGFPSLEAVGNILLRGNFEDVKMEKLKDVKGSATATSTTDISKFCKFFDKLKDNNAIRGEKKCSSNNKDANGPGSKSTTEEKDAAGMVSVSTTLLALAVFAGVAQML